MTRPPVSLRVTIPAIILSIGLVISAGAVWLNINWSEQHILTISREALLNDGRLFASDVQAALRLADAATARAKLMRASSNRRISAAALIEGDGRIRFSTILRQVGRHLGETPRAYGLDGIDHARAELAPLTLQSKDRNRLLLIHPVRLEIEPGELIPTKLGFVALEYDLTDLRELARANAMREGAAILAFMIALCALATTVLHVWIAKPIGSLVGLADRIAAGDFDAGARVRGGDELARLAHAVVRMAHRLKERTARLVESEENFRNLVEGSIQGVLLHCDGRPVFANQAFAELFGYATPAHVMEIDRVENFFAPHERERLITYQEAPAKGAPVPSIYEVDAIRNDGTLIHLLMMVRLVTWQRQRTFQCTVIDLTDLKAAEEKLHQAQKMEAVGQLTGGIAHDFNNLLAVIVGNVELLQEKIAGDAESLALAQAAGRAAERGSQLTHRLMAFSRRQPLAPKVVDFNGLVSDMTELLRRTLGEAIEVKTELSDDLWHASVDPAQVEAAILNLAVNARDAMPDGGELTIRTSNAYLLEHEIGEDSNGRPGEFVLLAVYDTGVGIAPEVLERVFEPFFTTKEPGKGTGLGLSMVYGFIKQSGGHVAIESEPKSGTSVKMYFPRTLEEAGEVRETPARDEDVRAKGEHVLVVEDDAEVRILAGSFLKDLGYDVAEAASAADLVPVLENGAPIDLLVTDVILPGGVSGRDVACRVRRRWPHVKVLYISVYPRDVVDLRGRLDPGVRLLQKPFRRADFARQVRQVLEGAA